MCEQEFDGSKFLRCGRRRKKHKNRQQLWYLHAAGTKVEYRVVRVKLRGIEMLQWLSNQANKTVPFYPMFCLGVPGKETTWALKYIKYFPYIYLLIRNGRVKFLRRTTDYFFIIFGNIALSHMERFIFFRGLFFSDIFSGRIYRIGNYNGNQFRA